MTGHPPLANCIQKKLEDGLEDRGAVLGLLQTSMERQASVDERRQQMDERRLQMDERRLQMDEEKTKGITAMMLALAERLGPKPASDGK